MKVTNKEFSEFLEKTDLSDLIALDMSVFSNSLNAMVCGRIQRITGGVIVVHTGSNFQYTINVTVVGDQRLDIFFVKRNKVGGEFISKHINFQTKDPCSYMINALIDKIEKDGGTLRKMFPFKRISKCLSEEPMLVRDEDKKTLQDDEDIYGYETGWGGMYNYPYAGHSSSSREKKFYFKEYRGRTVVSK